MKSGLKILGVIAVIAALLFIGLVVAVNLLLTPERVRATIVPLAEQSLNRNISIGDINISLFRGIEVRDFKIFEPDGQEVFVSSGLMRLNYQLLPLLSKQVIIDEVRLESPQVRVVRQQDGSFNFSDLRDAPRPGDEAFEKRKAAAAEQTLSLLVSQVHLQDGRLLFFDAALNSSAPYRYELSGLNLSMDRVTLDQFAPYVMQAQFNGGKIVSQGEVRLQPFSGRFEVSLVELDVTTFKPYFKDAMAGDVTGLKLSYEAEVDLSPQSIKTKGELTTSAFDLVLNAMPEAPFAQVRFGLSHDLLLDLEKDSLTLNSIAFTLNDNRLEASGAISALSEQPQADLQLNIPTIEVRSLLASLPRKLVVDLAAFDPAGQISGQAKLSGGLEDPVALLQSAQIDLESVQLSVGAMRPALSGTVQLQGEELLAEALTLRAGDNRANIRLTATNLFTPPLIVVADLSAEQLSLDALTGENDAADATADPQEGASSETKAAAQELGPFDIPVHAVGKVRVEQMLWKGLAVDNFTADYELINNRMQLKNVGGAVAGGKVDSALTLDLTRAGLAYSGQLALEGVQADPLLTAFVPAAVGALDGATSLKIDLDGSGTQWSAIKRQLSVRGDLLLSEGYLAAPTLVHGLSGFLHLPQLERIDFDKLQSDVKIVGGKMLIDSMFASESMKFYPKGVVTLDGDIDIALDTRLSPELAAKLDSKGTLSSYLSDQEGWSQLPLLLSGNLSSPHFALDPKGVSKQATKALTGELDRQLDKLLKKDAAPEQDSSDQTQEESQGDSAEELLKKSLRDLFNN